MRSGPIGIATRRDETLRRCWAAPYFLAGGGRIRNYFPSARKIMRVPLSKCTLRLDEPISDSGPEFGSELSANPWIPKTP